MNTTKIKLTLIGICGLVLVPLSSHAGTATLLDDRTVLYTIDFVFNDDKSEVQVPLMADYGVSYTDRVDTVGYTLEGEAELETVSGLVLSRQPLVDDRYLVPAGEEGVFTLMILASYEEALTENQQARITKIPYFWPDRRTTVHQNQLDELEPAILDVSKSGAILRASE